MAECPHGQERVRVFRTATQEWEDSEIRICSLQAGTKGASVVCQFYSRPDPDHCSHALLPRAEAAEGERDDFRGKLTRALDREIQWNNRAEAWREVAKQQNEGLKSCRDYLADLSRSGAVAGHEMQMPSYEVTDALAAYGDLVRGMEVT